MTTSNTPAAPISCVGIIMDGNRRWAIAHDLPRVEGHSEGYKKFKDVAKWARDAGIPHLAAYVFSTENWQRPEEEVAYLMKLLRSVLEQETEKMVKERARVRFVGDRSRFSKEVQELMERMESATAKNFAITLHLLLSYGGRAEIVDAAAALAKESLPVTDESLREHMWSAGMPDPDLIIRTGGEKRLSGFLPWQSVYSELFFVDALWPDFSQEEFDAILAEFATRERRNGK